ncbi:MAG: NADP-dependent oxidoreductase, partial [Alphaproteobacteria bacterium]
MRAVYYEKFGGADVLKVGELPVPKPEKGEVLIRVAGAGVNPIDWKLREGFAVGLFPYTFPIV